MSDTKMDNCKFSFKCPKKWSSLRDIGINNQRYCGSCKEVVHWCDTQEDVDKATSENWCVAFTSKPTSQVKNWNSDEDGFLEFHMGRVEKVDQKVSKKAIGFSFTRWLKKIVG